jgi:cell division protein FtsB
MRKLPWDKATLYRNGMLILILVCIGLIVHDVFGENGYLALRRQHRDVKALREQIQQLNLENEQLEQQIKALKSDPKAIERLAREQMRMARPGELIYTLPDKAPQKQEPATARQTPPK